MANVFLSFLGTNRYLPCNYYYGDKKIRNVTFVQEALVSLFCTHFNENDRIVIFITPEAEKVNWHNSEKNEGLSSILKRCNLASAIKPVTISTGHSEEEIWEVFNTLYDNIEQNDEIILDITHAFRSLPLLGTVCLNYARFLKKIKVKGIYYGAFEVLGTRDKVAKMEMESRNAPVFDLSSFDLLQQWSSAFENFVNHGITRSISNLIYQQVNPLLKNSQGKDTQADEERQFAKALDMFGSYFSTVRGESIVEGKEIIFLKNRLNSIRNSELRVKALGPLFQKVSETIEPYGINNIKNGFFAVQWCIENGLIQQGITMLQETIVTYALERIGEDRRDVKKRQAFSSFVYLISTNREFDSLSPQDKEIVNIFSSLKDDSTMSLLMEVFTTLRDYRNDINHGGYVQPAKPGRFQHILHELFEKVKEVVLGV